MNVPRLLQLGVLELGCYCIVLRHTGRRPVATWVFSGCFFRHKVDLHGLFIPLINFRRPGATVKQFQLSPTTGLDNMHVNVQAAMVS